VTKLRILRLSRLRMPLCTVAIVCLVAVLSSVVSSVSAQAPRVSPSGDASTRPVFSEADAARVMDNLRQAMESENSRRFMKLFDAKKMPGFAAFRDQVSVFHERFGLILMTYQLTQVTTDGEFGAAMADITMNATAKQTTTPNLRRAVSVRLVLAWDGKAWKIVDWSPRDFFQ
jgi:hypothetical protein